MYPDEGGQFVLRAKLVGATAITTLGETRRYLNPYADVVAGDRIPIAKFSAKAILSNIPAGTYDLWLEYQRQGASSAIEQVIIGVTNLDINVQRG